MHTPILSLLVTSVKKYAYLVTRDYGEITNLLTNKQSALKFAEASNLKFQQSVLQDLQNFKPAYGFECANLPPIINQDKSNTFVINGIVGMQNFFRGIPYFALSINLQRDGKIFSGVLYNPVTLDMFYTQYNEGAFFNNKRLRYTPSNLPKQEHLIATDTNASAVCLPLDMGFFLANRFDAINFTKDYNYNLASVGLLLAQEAGALLKYDVTNGIVKNIIND